MSCFFFFFGFASHVQTYYESMKFQGYFPRFFFSRSCDTKLQVVRCFCHLVLVNMLLQKEGVSPITSDFFGFVFLTHQFRFEKLPLFISTNCCTAWQFGLARGDGAGSEAVLLPHTKKWTALVIFRLDVH